MLCVQRQGLLWSDVGSDFIRFTHWWVHSFMGLLSDAKNLSGENWMMEMHLRGCVLLGYQLSKPFLVLICLFPCCSPFLSLIFSQLQTSISGPVCNPHHGVLLHHGPEIMFSSVHGWPCLKLRVKPHPLHLSGYSHVFHHHDWALTITVDQRISQRK